MVNVAISIGPVPAKLDSVKYVSNRFKGRLGLKVAKALRDKYDHKPTIFKWKYSDLPTSLSVIEFDDILDYRNKILNFKADAYILSAAVANLMPVNPWPNKFPSHNYNVGEEFDIKFRIAPRIIDRIKSNHPHASLIGYKLFDGDYEELIAAGRKVLIESRANIIFANTPSEAKSKKYMLTQDMSIIPVSFDEHIDRINNLIASKFYHTKIVDIQSELSDGNFELAKLYPRTIINNRAFGCFAMREMGGRFLTTSRGKKEDKVIVVANVDHNHKIIYASGKATMNAPLLDMIFRLDDTTNVILHDHKIIGGVPTYKYQSPGTDKEVELGMKSDPIFNIEGHGYIAKFNSVDKALGWANEH